MKNKVLEMVSHEIEEEMQSVGDIMSSDERPRNEWDNWNDWGNYNDWMNWNNWDNWNNWSNG